MAVSVIGRLARMRLRGPIRGRKSGRTQCRPFYILADGLGRGEMDADGPSLVAFFANANRGFVALDVKVLGSDSANGADANAGVQAKS